MIEQVGYYAGSAIYNATSCQVIAQGESIPREALLPIGIILGFILVVILGFLFISLELDMVRRFLTINKLNDKYQGWKHDRKLD